VQSQIGTLCPDRFVPGRSILVLESDGVRVPNLAICQRSELRRRRGDADIASIGTVLGEPARCRILMALDGGRALPASFLAAEAGLAGSTTSVHLSKLVAAGLLRVEASGRHRYYSLAGPEVGELLEVLTRIAPTRPVRSLSEDTRAARLREGRTCYDHLAGRVGVAIMDGLVENRLISGAGSASNRTELVAAPGREVDYRLTENGREFFLSLGADLPAKSFPIRYCIDWSERRHHLAGVAGRQLLRCLIELRWISRDVSGRAVEVTAAGRRGLRERLSVISI